MKDLDPKTHTEYSGPVGYEKAIHKTHFSGLEKPLRKTGKPDKYEWVEFAPGRFKRVKKEEK